MDRATIRLNKVSPGHLRILIIAFLVGANLFVWLFSGYALHQSRQQNEMQARALTQNMAQAVDYSLSNSIDKVDLALRAVADELQRQLSDSSLDPEKVGELLARYQERLPEVEAIRIADASGRVVFGRGLDPKEGVNWSDRDFFSYFRDHPEAGLHVSKPRVGRVAKKTIIGLERRYNRPDGSFGGIVAASVALDYFSELLSRLQAGSQAALVLRDADLGLIARYPAAPGAAGTVGSAVVSSELQELFRSQVQTATYHTRQASDQRERIITFRRVSGAPMVILAGVASDDYLADWRAEAWNAASGVVGFAFLSLLSGWLALALLARLSQEIEENRRQQRALEESEETERQQREELALAASVFTHAHEGIMICDASQAILDVNPIFSEITGYERREVIGRTPRFLSSGHQDSDFYRTMWQAIRDHGHWEGEVWNRRKDGSSYAERLSISSVVDDRNQVTHYIGTFSDISLLKRHQAELERLAHYDSLTHLPNRALLSDRLSLALAQARRSGALVALCYLDLDGFKAINDELGHDAGDAFLVEAAQRLRDMVRAGDTVARLGGDEFVLLLGGGENREECERAAVRILRAVAAPFHVKGQERTVSGSLGIALFPDDGGDPDTLLRHADQAMYQAKQAGKNRYLFFDSTSCQRARDRRQALERFRPALEKGELRLYYQPIVDLRQGKVLRFEGLLRWRHPERGLLLPADFLPAVLGSELEVDLGRWVLAEGLRQLAEWRRQGLSQGLNLNISPGHLLSPDFVGELAAQLATYPELEPHALEIEILEPAAMEGLEKVIAVFRRCHELGVDIALDDFGTGHSSLSYFRRLPVDTLKIDQVFIQSVLGDAEDLAVVESVVGLTRAFKRKLVAEGIQSVEIGMLLLNLGCSVGQGYGIARPLPAADVPAWVAAFVPDRNWSLPVSEFSREDWPLFMAELEHRSWVRQMGAWLAADPETPFPPPEDGRLCRFGQWYSGPGRTRYGRFESFQAMGEIHDAVHRLGQELVQLVADGRREEASRRFGEMTDLRDRLVEQLSSLQAEVILEKI